MKGPSSVGSQLVMTQLGGVLGDLGMHIEGEPHLDPGQRYVLFLYPASDHRTLRPVGMSQGVMPLREQNGDTIVYPGGAGLSLVQRVAGGQLMPAPPALVHPEPWDQVRARIMEVVASRGRGP
jgi:hypothetical protein